MDPVAVLESILVNTYNSDSRLREQAEQALNQFLRNHGALFSMLTFIGNTNNHKELRQATGIVIKNKLRDFWREDNPEYPMTHEEKEAAKHKILDILLVELDNSIRGIIGEAVKVVAEFDFPDRWPALIPTILANLSNPDVLKIYNSLLALRKLIKRYEYKPTELRQPLNDVIAATFPHIQQLMQHVIEHNTLEAAQVMKMCLKIFWSATTYQLPPNFSMGIPNGSSSSLGGGAGAQGGGGSVVHVGTAVSAQGQQPVVDMDLWFRVIAHVWDKNLPEASENKEPFGQPIEYDDRKAWPWWKLKKWASRIGTHFIQRYGNPRYAGEEMKQFAEYFRAHTAAVLMGPAMNCLSIKANDPPRFLTDDVHRVSLSYIAACVEMSPTYKLLKPHLDFLLFRVIFPTLCLKEQDIRLFSEDPVEFVRKVHNPLEDWLDPLVAATNLLQMLARYRQKDTLPKLLPFIHTILQEYDASPPEMKDYRKKDAALVTVSVVAKILSENKTYEGHLFPFLAAHLLPEFQCPVPFIRARACWAVEYFHHLSWSKGPSVQNPVTGTPMSMLEAILQGLIAGLRDKALPVQAAAACSIRLLITAKGAKKLLRPILRDLVQEYFRIMEEVGNESVLSALQTIVEQYGEEVADMAPAMVAHLVKNFHQYSEEGKDDDDAAFTASQCLETVSAVLSAVEDKPEVIAQMEPSLVPLALSILGSGEVECFEYIDNAVEFLGFLTYSGDGISVPVWSCCGPLLQALKMWAIDYLSEMVGPILNYMTKDMGTFLQGVQGDQPFVIIVIAVVATVFAENSESGESDGTSGATLLTCLLTTCKSEQRDIHALLPSILSMTVQRLLSARSRRLQLHLLEVVLAAIYYDAVIFLQVLQADPTLAALQEAVFTKLFECLPMLDGAFTQRLIVLALTNLLTLLQHPAGSLPVALPEALQRNFPSIFKQVIRELALIEEGENEEEMEDVDDEEEGEEGEEEEEEGEDGIEVDDDEDDEDQHEGGTTGEDGGMSSARAKALYVPEGGYGEDEDCVNAEDEEYRQVLESMAKDERVRRELYIAGERVSSSGEGYGDDDEEEEGLGFTSPIENMDVAQVFVAAMKALAAAQPAAASQLQSALDAEDIERFKQLYANSSNAASIGAGGAGSS